MTDDVLDQPSSAAVGPIRERRRRPTRAARRRRRNLTIAGLSLITAGVLVLGWLAWQFWGTNWVSQQRQAEAAAALRTSWDDGQASARTDFGNASALLRINRFGPDFEVPVLEGVDDDALTAGVGHFTGTAQAGGFGNYALAGHRVTNGEPFADFPDLRPGDLVEVETVDAVYTYELDTGGTDLELPFTEDWVLAPRPQNPDPGGIEPPSDAGNRLITLVTCSEIFHTDNRSVVFGHLVKTEETSR